MSEPKSQGSPPSWVDALADRLTGVVAVEREIALSGLTTYHLGGPVAALVRATSVADLAAVAEVVAELRPPLLVVGRGSNLLVADRGYAGLAILLVGDFDAIELEGNDVVWAGGAVALPVLARRAAAVGRTGLEFYVGIPGSVGGAVRMNAGGHGRETADVVVSAEVMDLAIANPPDLDARPSARGVDALGFGYRHSALSPTEVVTGATFRAGRGDPEDCERAIAEIVRWRREHQPGGANAGSVFSNPPGDSAGRIIDAPGLKGFRVGGAVVSPKHANFFQAEAHATADDVRQLVVAVRERVHDATGIDLQPELRMVGFES